MFDSIDNFLSDELKSEFQGIDWNIENDQVNSEISTLLNDTVFVGGKRIRPLLTYLFGNLFSLDPQEVTPYAKAIELVHAASLCHDDVIDDAHTRRGKDSINIVSSNKKAVLAGDYLFSNVVLNVAKKGRVNLVQEIAQVIQDLSDGEWLQLNLSEKRNYTKERIEEVAIKKTGSVMRWCCVVAPSLADASKEVKNHCLEFSKNLGVAFQYVDDTLDFSDDLNKDQLIDLKNGIINSVIFQWFKLNPEIERKFLSGEDISTLFHNDGIEKAVSIVKLDAISKLDKAKFHLDGIVKELSNNGNLEELLTLRRPIDFILEYLGSRTY